MLRQALDSVDRLRKRSVITFAVTAALSQIAWFALVFVAFKNGDVKQTMLAARLALAMCVFGGVFMLVLHITRMTQRILQAIEIVSKQ